MSWENPKTNWGQAGQTVPGVADFNRIEENIRILGEYKRAPGYGVAYGTNAKTITLDPSPTSYYDGLCFAFKNNEQNTGAVTINVNGLGAKSIKKPNGNDVAAGNLKAGSVYTIRYNNTNFILQGSDSSGNATPEHVLAGKTFSNDNDTGITGTMPNRGTVSYIITTQGGEYEIPAGYHNGNGAIAASFANLTPGNVRYDVNVGGVIGTLRELKYVTGTVSIPGESSDGYLSRSFAFPSVGMSYPVLVVIRNSLLTSPAISGMVGFRTIRDLPLFNAQASWGTYEYVEVNSDGKGVTDVHTSSGFSASKTIRYYIVGYD